MTTALIVVTTPILFGILGMAAAYLDRGYSPVICMCLGVAAGLAVALLAVGFMGPRVEARRAQHGLLLECHELGTSGARGKPATREVR